MITTDTKHIVTLSNEGDMMVEQEKKEGHLVQINYYRKRYLSSERIFHADGRYSVININSIFNIENDNVKDATITIYDNDDQVTSQGAGIVTPINRKDLMNKPSGFVVDGKFQRHGETRNFEPETGNLLGIDMYQFDRKTFSNRVDPFTGYVILSYYNEGSDKPTQIETSDEQGRLQILQLSWAPDDRTAEVLSDIQVDDENKEYARIELSKSAVGRFIITALDTLTPYHWKERDAQTLKIHQIKAVKEKLQPE